MENWRKYAISDVGCGMALFKSNRKLEDFSKDSWNNIYYDLKKNKGKLGDLGSGNHFLDALQCYSDDYIYFLIHTGSRDESKVVEKLIDDPVKFDKVYFETVDWARQNRLEISKIIEKYFGKLEIILDRNHNSFEFLDDSEIIIRKGAVQLLTGDLAVIPSNMDGDVLLVRANENIEKVLNSLSHGTGRVMSRSAAKELAVKYSYTALRNRIYIPEMISDSSIKTEAPFCYRDLDSCMELIKELVYEVERFSVFAYLGQI